MIKQITVLLFTISVFACSQKQPKESEEKTRMDVVCDSVVNLFAQDNIEASMDLVRQNTVIELSKIDTLKKMAMLQRDEVFPSFGKMTSAEFVKENRINNIIAKRFYIIKFTKFFLKVDITLYKSANGWKITSFHYKTDADELLDH